MLEKRKLMSDRNPDENRVCLGFYPNQYPQEQKVEISKKKIRLGCTILSFYTI